MDDGKRSSLYVTFARGFPRGITQLTPSGYPKPVGSAGLSAPSGSLFLHDIIERTQLFGDLFKCVYLIAARIPPGRTRGLLISLVGPLYWIRRVIIDIIGMTVRS